MPDKHRKWGHPQMSWQIRLWKTGDYRTFNPFNFFSVRLRHLEVRCFYLCLPECSALTVIQQGGLTQGKGNGEVAPCQAHFLSRSLLSWKTCFNSFVLIFLLISQQPINHTCHPPANLEQQTSVFLKSPEHQKLKWSKRKFSAVPHTGRSTHWKKPPIVFIFLFWPELHRTFHGKF